MQMNITFRHIDPIDSLKNYAREKVDRVNKYLDKATEANVVLSLERHLHHADIRIQSGNFILRGREKSEDMYASIDLAMDKIDGNSSATRRSSRATTARSASTTDRNWWSSSRCGIRCSRPRPSRPPNPPPW